MERTELLNSPEYWLTNIQVALFNELTNYMEQHKLTQTQLAQQLNVSKSYISQVLRGDFNYKLSTLIELCMAIGKAPVIGFESIQGIIETENKQDALSVQKIINPPITYHINKDVAARASQLKPS